METQNLAQINLELNLRNFIFRKVFILFLYTHKERIGIKRSKKILQIFLKNFDGFILPENNKRANNDLLTYFWFYILFFSSK
jgi:hypothetical protein